MKRALALILFPLLTAGIAAEVPGRLMLDDFSTISSWLGGPRSKGTPGAVAPFDFSFGSTPDERRDDGFAGALHFDFAAPGGEASFAKNEVYQMRFTPRSIRYSLNADGHEGELFFLLRDAGGKEIRTQPERFGGDTWKNFTVPVDTASPVSIVALYCRFDRPGKGRILIDDLAVEIDVTGKELTVHNCYRKLAFAPGETVRHTYRVRNSLGRRVGLDAVLNIAGKDGKTIRTVKQKEAVEPFGSILLDFDLGTFPENGAYSCTLEINNGSSVTRFLGWLGVFTPNNGRINRKPMYFSVEDQEINAAPFETALHVEWMKLLGVDMIRAGMLGVALHPARNLDNFHKYREMWKPHREAGLMLQLDYAATVAPWTIPAANRKDKAWLNTLDCDWELFREHAEALAAFVRSMPEAKYFEWLNEPDLGSYKGTAENYFKSLRILYPILKAENPELKVTTGGITIDTPHSKKGFVRDLFRDHADYYDIAAFHEHAGFRTYQETVEKAVKLTGGGKALANTEAGARSYQGKPEQFYEQADQLVRKIVWSKARNLEFYNWFMLQDYWDKYINADDSFGLVTVENQPKPSFVAYNELIRQLANHDFAGMAELDARLEGCRFTGNGGEVTVLWSKDSGLPFTFPLRSAVPVERIDAFGAREELKPENGIIMVRTDRLPIYLRSDVNALQPLGALLEFTGEVTDSAGEKVSVGVRIRNPYRHAAKFRMIVSGDSIRGELPPMGVVEKTVAFTIPQSAVPGWRSLPVHLEFSGQKTLYRGEISLAYFVALPVFPEFRAENEIRLEDETRLTELIFDPSVPRWTGPEDLSASVRMKWGRKGLEIAADVRDQEHCTPSNDMGIWKNDAIQFAFAAPGKEITEFTVSGGTDGSTQAWCHLSPEKERVGKLDLPHLAVTREEGVTRYRLTVPWELIGVAPEPGVVFGMSFLICDNDGNRRLRLMSWGGGIEGTKNPQLFQRIKLNGTLRN